MKNSRRQSEKYKRRERLHQINKLILRKNLYHSDDSQSDQSSSSLLSHDPAIYTTEEKDTTTRTSKPWRKSSAFYRFEQESDLSLEDKKFVVGKKRILKRVKKQGEKKEHKWKRMHDRTIDQGYKVMIEENSFSRLKKRCSLKYETDFKAVEKGREAKFPRNRCFVCGRKASEWRTLLRHLKMQHSNSDIQMFNFSDDNADIELPDAKHLVVVSVKQTPKTKIVYSKHNLLETDSEVVNHSFGELEEKENEAELQEEEKQQTKRKEDIISFAEISENEFRKSSEKITLDLSKSKESLIIENSAEPKRCFTVKESFLPLVKSICDLFDFDYRRIK